MILPTWVGGMAWQVYERGLHLARGAARGPTVASMKGLLSKVKMVARERHFGGGMAQDPKFVLVINVAGYMPSATEIRLYRVSQRPMMWPCIKYENLSVRSN